MCVCPPGKGKWEWHCSLTNERTLACLLVVEWAPVAVVATLRSVGAVDVVSSRAEEPKPQSLALPQKSEDAF